jgi:hypothetical protein
MMETRLRKLLYGSSYFATVIFGGDRQDVTLMFGHEEFPDFEDGFDLQGLNDLIHMLSVARDELESRQPTNKETE